MQSYIKRLVILNSLFISFYSQAQFKDTCSFVREEIKKFFAAIQPLRGDLYISTKPKESITKEIVNVLFPHDTFFSKADLDFIEKQSTLNKISAWDSFLIDKQILIKDTDAKSKERYISYSVPAFSLNFQICILFVDINCNLGLCGGGYILILKKKNNTWEIVDGEMTWVS